MANKTERKLQNLQNDLKAKKIMQRNLTEHAGSAVGIFFS